MKKSIIVIALAIVLALSFATIATAKYAGYAYNNPVKNASGGSDVNKYPGYLSWSGAQAIYGRNNAGAEMTTAHGGYVSSTTKCAVCHSAHRAYSPAATTASAAPVNTSLTSGSSCVNCHTAWGAGSSTKKIEWANVNQGLEPGPHASDHNFPKGCASSCHTGGIHGGSLSAYNGMNAYMLGGDKDTAITEAFTKGNVSPSISYDADGDGLGANWFQNGTSGTPSNMDTPDQVNAAQFGAAKAMATGYTCAQSGCHTSSQFAVNTWGFAEDHASDPRSSGTLDKPFTGHITSFQRDYGREYSQCGPCHPGAPAGGYRTYGNTGQPEPEYTDTDPANFEDIFNARAYGCDQCHDMVGKLTNTTAWPHGNRNIDVWEWEQGDARGEITKTTLSNVPSGNLWMYASSLVVDGQPNKTKYPADGSFKVISDAIVHEGEPGNIFDGACLKCHIAVDPQSIAANDKLNASLGVTIATEHAHKLFVDGSGTLMEKTESTSTPYVPFTPDPDTDYTGKSTQIFLWK